MSVDDPASSRRRDGKGNFGFALTCAGLIALNLALWFWAYYGLFIALGKPAAPTVWWRWFVEWHLLLVWLGADVPIFFAIAVHERRKGDDDNALFGAIGLALFLVANALIVCGATFSFHVFTAGYAYGGLGWATGAVAAFAVGLLLVAAVVFLAVKGRRSVTRVNDEA